MPLGIMIRKCLLLIATLTLATHAYAAFSPQPGYTTNTVLGSQSVGFYDVYDDGGNTRAYAFNGTLKRFDVNNGGQLADLGAPAGYSGFTSFVRRSPDGNSVWVGFTVSGNTDDRIYEVTNLDTTPVWNLRATVAGNYDLAFRGNEAFITASDFVNNTIYWLDAANSYNAVSFATAGSFSAGLAFSATDLFYATSGFGSGQTLIQFDDTQLTNFLANPGAWVPLGIGDATTLATLPGSAGGTSIFVDAADNVYFAVNDFSAFPTVDSSLLKWDGVIGTGANYELIGVNTDDASFGVLDGIGIIDSDGNLYLASFGENGIAQIGVPEPGTYGLILGLALMLPAVRRLRRKQA